MRNVILLFLALFSCELLFSQTNYEKYQKDFATILNQIEMKEYYDAIKNMDLFNINYPNNAGMYYNRGMVNFKLNNYKSAIADLKKSKELGNTFQSNFVSYLTDKEYLVKLLCDHYIDFKLLSPTNGYKQIYGRKDSLRGALRTERNCFDVTYYNLTVKIMPSKKSIEGRNQIYFTTTHTTSRIQIDLTQNYSIQSITRKSKELQYSRLDNAILIDLGEKIPTNQKESITITYSGKPRVAPNPPWDGGFVWKHSRFSWWIGVACEQFGASTWWPCKDHLSDKPDSMTINIQVPNGYKAIANGNLRSTKAIDNKYTNYEWYVSYPINSYGVTFYMGKFIDINEKFTNTNGTYDMDYYVLAHHEKKARKFYGQMKDIITIYEKLFGEYPYKNDGVGMVEAPYEGMEHQSAIAIGGRYGKGTPWNYNDIPYNYLLIHETAHEWWGNTITMADMADAWLSEGFTTYSEQLFMEQRFGYKSYLNAVANNMSEIFNVWPIVGIKDVNDNSFIGGDIYNKGATTLNNLRCTINNDSLFFSMLKEYYNKFKFKTIATSDFTNFVNEKTGKDYSDFFDKFLNDTEPPTLEYKFIQKDDTLKFSYKWINVGKNFTMPFSITINDKTNYRLEATTESQVFVLDKVKSFYLPSEKRLDKEQMTKNAFTYYWTSWNSMASWKL